MTPATNQILTEKVFPVIRKTVPRVVRKVGCDDREELVQDASAVACQMADRLEKAGKPIYANSLIYYPIQWSKSGRRSYSSRRSDALSAGTQLDGNSALHSMDADITGFDSEDRVTLEDVVPDQGRDPFEIVAERLDWEDFGKTLSHRDRAILAELSRGFRPIDCARRHSISPSTVTELKRNMKRKIKEFMGEDVLSESTRKTGWRRDLDSLREKALSRMEHSD